MFLICWAHDFVGLDVEIADFGVDCLGLLGDGAVFWVVGFGWGETGFSWIFEVG